jgi:hypothetical protein
MRNIIKTLIATTAIISSSVFAYGYSIPANLVALDSDYGQEIFSQSNYKEAYWGLSEQFVTQSTGTDCGIASAVMVVNALNIRPPQDPEHPGFYQWSQINILPVAAKVFSINQLNYVGLSLPDEANLLAQFGLHSTYYYGKSLSLDEFRYLTKQAVSQKNSEAVVDFSRKSLNQVGDGHFSPIAAYDSNSDRFLLMDVARYKYPPVWVTTSDLYHAIRENGSWRGLVVVSKDTAS